MSKKKKAVVVFDTHRGIYFGYLTRTFNEGKSVELSGFRHCYYFGCTKGHEGAFGLASYGPSPDSKVGPRLDSVVVHDVSKVAECSADAVERWENAGW